MEKIDFFIIIIFYIITATMSIVREQKAAQAQIARRAKDVIDDQFDEVQTQYVERRRPNREQNMLQMIGQGFMALESTSFNREAARSDRNQAIIDSMREERADELHSRLTKVTDTNARLQAAVDQYERREQDAHEQKLIEKINILNEKVQQLEARQSQPHQVERQVIKISNMPCLNAEKCVHWKRGKCEYFHENDYIIPSKPAKTCNYGDDCINWKRGTCKFFHENNYIIPSKTAKKCNNGDECNLWKRGKCEYFHENDYIIPSKAVRECNYGDECINWKRKNCEYYHENDYVAPQRRAQQEVKTQTITRSIRNIQKPAQNLETSFNPITQKDLDQSTSYRNQDLGFDFDDDMGQSVNTMLNSSMFNRQPNQ